MKVDGDGRNLLDQPYPIMLIQRASHRPRHRQRSSRRQLGRRPDGRTCVRTSSAEGHVEFFDATLANVSWLIRLSSFGEALKDRARRWGC